MKKAILTSNKEINLIDGSKAYPLNMPNLPKGDGTPESIIKIFDFLNVESSPRYKRKEVNGVVVSTYCNIYAFDVANLAGAYLPRVWWGQDAIKDLNTMDVQAKYGVTVFELNANSLFDWFAIYSDDFGWSKPKTLEDAQKLANEGEVVVIVAKQKITSRSGHIVVISPEINGQSHKIVNGKFCPVQSQAGWSNKKYFVDDWYLNPRYSSWGVWSYKV